MASQVLLALMAALVMGCCAADSCANTNSLDTELLRITAANGEVDFDENKVKSDLMKAEGEAATPTPPACPSGFITKDVNGFRFCWKQGGVNYASARQACQNINMQVVEITSAEKATAVDSFCTYDCAWLGLTCPVQTSQCDSDMSQWLWSNADTKLTDTYNAFKMDGDGTIHGGGPTEYCAHWWKVDGSKGRWGPQTCSSTYYGTLCEDKTQAPTPEPTPVPTPAPFEAQATGDPHITNLIGRSFDVKQPGEYTLARIPKEGAAVLKVDSLIESIGNACSMFITEVSITGALLSSDSIRVRASRQNSYKSHHQEPVPFSLQLAPGMPWIPLSSFPEGDEVHMKGYSMGNTSVEIKAKRDTATFGYGNHSDDSGVNGFFIVNIIVPKQPLHTQIKLSKRRAWLNVHLARLANLGHSEVGGILGTTEPDKKWSEPTPACERHIAGADGTKYLNLLHLDGGIQEEGQIASATD